MKEKDKPISREMFYKAQKHHADMIKEIKNQVSKLIELLEELLKK